LFRQKIENFAYTDEKIRQSFTSSPIRMESSLITYRAGEYALRIKGSAEASVRTPTHYIVLLDTSSSMRENSKMENVKLCLDAMLSCLSAEDMLSIITFETTSTIRLQCMNVNEAHKEHIRSTIDKIVPENLTNLSAGLGNIRNVLAAAPSMKTGVLLLTDGHINRGITNIDALKDIIHDILHSHPQTSIHCVGYGTDHNNTLLCAIALETQGSYNIVNTLEDVATAFGDTLGGLMSCVAQNVEVLLPAGSVLRGPFTVQTRDDGTIHVPIGDLYASTERIILYSAPTARAAVNGMLLPLLTPHHISLEAVPTSERIIEIELTALRYKCTEILQGIQATRGSILELRAMVDEFKAAVVDTAYNASPVIAQLRAEVAVMEEAMYALTYPSHGVESAVISQHISYYALGRGFSTPSRLPGPSTASPEDPTNSAIFQNDTQRDISSALRNLTCPPDM
jgi:hypothetical protein